VLKLNMPAELYVELFEAVQTSGVLGDSKTFVDAVPKSDPRAILYRYRKAVAAGDVDLPGFIRENFELPLPATAGAVSDRRQPVLAHIEQLWDVLARASDTDHDASSLLELPHPYIVPGGRFREIYYWDSYFTLLGLAASGRRQQIEDMVANFAYLIDQVGFIPNGNRSYFCSRSQPPFFALMVELLAGLGDGRQVYQRFLPQLLKEHAFWMAGRETTPSVPVARIVPVPGGMLNRYWDDDPSPRPESYAEDLALAAASSRDQSGLFRDIRAACESGWDFSSRWLADARSLASIRTTSVVPVDLNALLCKLESVIATACEATGQNGTAGHFRGLAANRTALIRRLFFCATRGTFTDLLLPDLAHSESDSLAQVFPLFLELADARQARAAATRIHEQFLAPGGWLTSCIESGQQWDAPNGWAPLQWACYRGLMNYGFEAEAREGATRWVQNNLAVYADTGRLLEKYDVIEVGRLAGGGEYGVQDGFGWTNGVLQCLIGELAIDC